MTSPAAALEFFVSEASGYIDGLDTLISSAGPAGPDREAFVRLARALRGNSTMYRQPAISRVASALERVARSLRDGAVSWNPRLGAALVAAVDDLRILLRNVRSWGPADDQRAQARAAELEMMAPTAGHAPAPPAPDAGRDFLAAKAREVAGTIDRVVSAPGDRAALSSLLRAVRGLNGIAALREHPALPEVGGAAERIAQGADLAGEPPRQGELALLRAAAAVLHRAAGEIAAGRRMDPAAPELREYARVAAGASEAGERPAREEVAHIARLYHED
jgi:chemotaxis protein histidine kinase CheA